MLAFVAIVQYETNVLGVEMNVLPIEKRAQILHLLVEGTSMRATSRIADVSINTVTKLLIDAGAACLAFQDEAIRNINSKRVQCDEIRSFCYSKKKNVAPEDEGALGHRYAYTWTAIDSDTKLAISWLVGRRDKEYGEAFVADLASRLANRIQLTTDGYGVYANDIEKAFDGAVDYAMLVKVYEGAGGADQRSINGSPDVSDGSTSYVERQNLTMRMGMRWFARLTNGFSKKIGNLEHAIALHFMHYNFGRIHKALRVTPAMEAGISDHVWSMQEIAGLAKDEEPKKRGPYKNRNPG